jgi:hypothetical protein
VFTLREDLDEPRVSDEASAATKHCSPVMLKDGRIVFEPAGEGVLQSFDKDGFTATVAG